MACALRRNDARITLLRVVTRARIAGGPPGARASGRGRPGGKAAQELPCPPLRETPADVRDVEPVAGHHGARRQEIIDHLGWRARPAGGQASEYHDTRIGGPRLRNRGPDKLAEEATRAKHGSFVPLRLDLVDVGGPGGRGRKMQGQVPPPRGRGWWRPRRAEAEHQVQRGREDDPVTVAVRKGRKQRLVAPGMLLFVPSGRWPSLVVVHDPVRSWRDAMCGDRLPQSGITLEDRHRVPHLGDLAGTSEDEQVLALECVTHLRGRRRLELVELVLVDDPELGGVYAGPARRCCCREQLPLALVGGWRAAGRPAALVIPAAGRSGLGAMVSGSTGRNQCQENSH